MKRQSVFSLLSLLLLVCLLTASFPLTAAAKGTVGWTASGSTASDWWYYSRDNSDTVVSNTFGDARGDDGRSVVLTPGEMNRYGGDEMTFSFRFRGNCADTWANVGIPVQIDLDRFPYFYYSLASLPAGGAVEVKLDTSLAGATSLTLREAGEGEFDLTELYPKGGVTSFWVNFTLVCPNRQDYDFVFDYVMIGDAAALSFDVNDVERTMEPYALDFDAQDFVYYGKNDGGNVIRRNVSQCKNRDCPLSFETDSPEEAPGGSLYAYFGWPEGSTADFFQRIAYRTKVDLDDTPYLYCKTSFDRGDWLGISATECDFDQEGPEAGLGDERKTVPGAYAIDVKGALGGGVREVNIVLVFADMNFDGSEFGIEYLYFGNRAEAPAELKKEKETAPVTGKETEPQTEAPAVSETEATEPETSGSALPLLLTTLASAVVAAVCVILCVKKKRPLFLLGLLPLAVCVILTAVRSPFGKPATVPEETEPFVRRHFTPTEEPGALVHVNVTESETDVFRQNDAGKTEKFVVVRIDNPDKKAFDRLSLCYESGGKRVEREILPIDASDSAVSDAFYLETPFEGLLPAELKNGDETVWKGTLAVTDAPASVVIPASPRMTLSDLKPGMLRGANYFNRLDCWGKDWNSPDYTEKWKKDLTESVSLLHLNAIRAFTIFGSDELWEEANLPSAEAMARLGRFLSAADGCGLKVILCMNSGFEPGFMERYADNARYLRTIAELFRYDGRILAFDLANEIDTYQELESELASGKPGRFSRYLTECYPKLRDEWAPDHITMVGTGFRLENLKKLGIETELGSYHGYIQSDLPADRVADGYRAVFDPAEPWVMEEWGYSSEDKGGNEDEAFQKKVYESYLAAFDQLYADDMNLLGTFQWCIYDYADEAKVPVVERKNGVIRLDGSLKPAGELLAGYYAAQKEKNPAPWEK